MDEAANQDMPEWQRSVMKVEAAREAALRAHGNSPTEPILNARELQLLKRHGGHFLRTLLIFVLILLGLVVMSLGFELIGWPIFIPFFLVLLWKFASDIAKKK